MTYKGWTGTERESEWWIQKGEKMEGGIRMEEKVSKDMKVEIWVAPQTTLHYSDEGNKRKVKRKGERRRIVPSGRRNLRKDRAPWIPARSDL
jgi:hypothetical protein